MATSNQSELEITVEDLLIGLETDHGYSATVGNMARPNSNMRSEEIGAVCAYGNAALDVAKRAGIPLTVHNINYLGNSIASYFELFATDNHAHDLPRELNIISQNDSARLPWTEIAANVREAFTRITGKPLNSKFIVKLSKSELRGME